MHLSASVNGPYVPTGHFKQASTDDAPTFGLYVPAGHGVSTILPPLLAQ